MSDTPAYRGRLTVTLDTDPVSAATHVREECIAGGLPEDQAVKVANSVEQVVADLIQRSRELHAVGSTFEATRSVRTADCIVEIQTEFQRRPRGLIARLFRRVFGGKG